MTGSYAFPPNNNLGYGPLIFNKNGGNICFHIHQKNVYENQPQTVTNLGKKLDFSANAANEGSAYDSNFNSQNPLRNDIETSPVKPQPHYKNNFDSHDNIRVNPYQQLINQEYLEIQRTHIYKNKKYSCNCKRSKCLKFYCECYANGEICVNCNCTDCDNTIESRIEKSDLNSNRENTDSRQLVYNYSEDEKHNKKENPEEKMVCNCTKSNCLKKYCECFKSGISCNENCRCRDCSNMPVKLKDQIKKKKSILFSNIENNIRSPTFDISQFQIHKISILIQNKTIYVHESCPNDDDSTVKIKNNQRGIFIEIPKSLIDNQSTIINDMYSYTPVASKSKKRKRIHSCDSDDYNMKNNRTACETNKKINNYPRNLETKKLNLSDMKNKKGFF